MQIVQCPTTLYGSYNVDHAKVFLAGGISNCPDWQKEMVARFKSLDDNIILINPRRDTFDVTSPADSDFQIEWEYFHILQSDAMIFWFPYHTLCPITLYELGVAAARGTQLFVGCHPAYQRKFDVEKQLSLIRPDVVVHDNWEPLVEEVKAWYQEIKGVK